MVNLEYRTKDYEGERLKLGMQDTLGFLNFSLHARLAVFWMMGSDRFRAMGHFGMLLGVLALSIGYAAHLTYLLHPNYVSNPSGFRSTKLCV